MTNNNEAQKPLRRTMSHNTILYGPAGTGKTYEAMVRAVALIENKSIEEVLTETVPKCDNELGTDLKKDIYFQPFPKRFQMYCKEGRILMLSIHQSFGYEEFIQGIRPKIQRGEDSLVYALQNGLFKAFCRRAYTETSVKQNILTGVKKWGQNDKRIIPRIKNRLIKIKRKNTRSIKDPFYQHLCEEIDLNSTDKDAEIDQKLEKWLENSTHRDIWKVIIKQYPLETYSPTCWRCYSRGSDSYENNKTRRDCLNHNRIRIGWNNQKPNSDVNWPGKKIVRSFIHDPKIGDIVFSAERDPFFDAIGVITSPHYIIDGFDDDCRTRETQWITKKFKPQNLEKLSKNIQGKFTPKTFQRLTEKFRKNLLLQLQIISQFKPFVVILDEINRGNIAKIFGEIITLLDRDKRYSVAERMEKELNDKPYSFPYSVSLPSENGKTQPFAIPDNVYIIGTMNTADRSLTRMDYALRRRFTFRACYAHPERLEGWMIVNENSKVSLQKLLEAINKRIRALLGRDYRIGESVFLSLKEGNKQVELSEVKRAFQYHILPLLEEYFYDDWAKIRWVLNEQIYKEKDDAKILNPTFEMEIKPCFQKNLDALNLIDTYQNIIGNTNESTPNH